MSAFALLQRINVHLPVLGSYVASQLSTGSIVRCLSSSNCHFGKSSLDSFSKLKRPGGRIQATYIWIDGTGDHLRAKERILDKTPKRAEDLPCWSYDGRATFQAKDGKSELTLAPVAIYKDPFKECKGDVLCLCETLTPDGKPTKTNHRFACEETVKKAKKEQPWFGIEQNYVLLDIDGWPLGWPKNAYPPAVGQYYGAIGAHLVNGRCVMEAHGLACLYAGIDFGGSNVEAMPSQFEYQIGPSAGIKAADDLWISRFILLRIAETLGVRITFRPKPVKGDWPGSAGHCNFSTCGTRNKNGIKQIENFIKKLSEKHKEHLKVYDPHGGKSNEKRLNGKHNASLASKFTHGVGGTDFSVRIPSSVAEQKQGYLEDRRPGANMDPYQVINIILKTCVGGDDKGKDKDCKRGGKKGGKTDCKGGEKAAKKASKKDGKSDGKSAGKDGKKKDSKQAAQKDAKKDGKTGKSDGKKSGKKGGKKDGKKGGKKDGKKGGKKVC